MRQYLELELRLSIEDKESGQLEKVQNANIYFILALGIE